MLSRRNLITNALLSTPFAASLFGTRTKHPDLTFYIISEDDQWYEADTYTCTPREPRDGCFGLSDVSVLFEPDSEKQRPVIGERIDRIACFGKGLTGGKFVNRLERVVTWDGSTLKVSMEWI